MRRLTLLAALVVLTGCPGPSVPPPPESGGGNTAVKIIAIIGAVLLGIAVVCGGVVYYLVYSVKKGVSSLQEQITQEMEKQKKQRENSNKTKAQKVVDAFMQELKGNRIEAAYQMTTAAYQKRVSLDELIEDIPEAMQQAAVAAVRGIAGKR